MGTELVRARLPKQAVAALCAAGMVASCATSTGSGVSGGWQVDSIVSKCVLAIGGGALLGAIVGAAAGGNRRIGAGAAIGAGAGGVLCAVMASLDAQDRERVRLAQLDAATTGSVRSSTYVGADGRKRTIVVTPSAAPRRPATKRSAPRPAEKSKAKADVAQQTQKPETPANEAEIAANSGEQICRSVPATVTIEGGGTGQISQVVCRNQDGDWLPA